MTWSNESIVLREELNHNKLAKINEEENSVRILLSSYSLYGSLNSTDHHCHSSWICGHAVILWYMKDHNP